MTVSSERPDYEWHFKLSGDADEGGDPDALTAMVTEQVKALLRCVVFTSHGAALDVTGFRFLDESDGEHRVYPQPAGWRHADPELESQSEGGAPDPGFGGQAP